MSKAVPFLDHRHRYRRKKLTPANQIYQNVLKTENPLQLLVNLLSLILIL